MKKILLSSLAACLVITGMMFIAPHPLQSATLGIGASGWYTWWDPKPETRGAEADPAFMYGPQLLLQFSPTMSVSSVFLYGKFNYISQESSGDMSMDITRYDSDTTLSYALNPYVRFFGGLKFMGYKYDMGDHLSLGPGFGIGFVIPIVENIFCSMSLSGMYLWGDQTDKSSEGDRTMSFTEYGANSAIALVYMIPSSSVSLSIGGRYFFFRFEATDDKYSNQKENHHFYGVTASAMYMISL
jgi:hypothetical protein